MNTKQGEFGKNVTSILTAAAVALVSIVIAKPWSQPDPETQVGPRRFSPVPATASLPTGGHWFTVGPNTQVFCPDEGDARQLGPTQGECWGATFGPEG